MNSRNRVNSKSIHEKEIGFIVNSWILSEFGKQIMESSVVCEIDSEFAKKKMNS